MVRARKMIILFGRLWLAQEACARPPAAASRAARASAAACALACCSAAWSRAACWAAAWSRACCSAATAGSCGVAGPWGVAGSGAGLALGLLGAASAPSDGPGSGESAG